ncbi:hypothetical protein NDU88_004888 [Pleurodeles waltl]|uniref:Uncharacterized protein n=1 Tax=Pleurodeles waltl TaxID=8319 RepID=A0AAV7RKG6_PLEWA|nr:hypothetical protein NDU88_004888 [Pleurodeles waltl]
MAWAYFCWRDGGGFVTSTFPPTAGLAVCCGCRIFGGLAAAGQNDRGGFPRPRRDYGGFLTGVMLDKTRDTPMEEAEWSKSELQKSHQTLEPDE